MISLKEKLPSDKYIELKRIGRIIDKLYDVTEKNQDILINQILSFMEINPKIIRHIINNMFTISKRRFRIADRFGEILTRIACFNSDYRFLIQDELCINFKHNNLLLLHYCCRHGLFQPFSDLMRAAKNYYVDNNLIIWTYEMMVYFSKFLYQHDIDYYNKQFEHFQNIYGTQKIYDCLRDGPKDDFEKLLYFIDYTDNRDSLRSILYNDDLEKFLGFLEKRRIHKQSLDPKEFDLGDADVYGNKKFFDIVSFAPSLKIFEYLLTTTSYVQQYMSENWMRGGCVEIIKHLPKKMISEYYYILSEYHHIPILEWAVSYKGDINLVEAFAKDNNITYLLEESTEIDDIDSLGSNELLCSNNCSEILLIKLYLSEDINELKALIESAIQYDLGLVLEEFILYQDTFVKDDAQRRTILVDSLVTALSKRALIKYNILEPTVNRSTYYEKSSYCFKLLFSEGVYKLYRGNDTLTLYDIAYCNSFFNAFRMLVSRSSPANFHPDQYIGVNQFYKKVLMRYEFPVHTIPDMDTITAYGIGQYYNEDNLDNLDNEDREDSSDQ